MDLEIKIFKQFLGKTQQKVVKNELHSRKFDINRGISYHRYAIQIYSVTQYLDANFSEEYLLDLLIQHFDGLFMSISYHTRKKLQIEI